jgi:AraC-like DNA-binding protein
VLVLVCQPMSRERQPQRPPLDEDGITIRSLALRFPSGHEVAPHAHPWGQLVYATEGVMTVTTPVGDWVVPPSRAAWVPADTEHSIRATDRVHLRTLYVRPDLTGTLPRDCRVLAVSALLRELILATLESGYLHERIPEQARLAGVLLDRVRVTDEVPLQLPWPTDPRARRVAERAQADLADGTPLAGLADGSGASVRTLERLFVRDTRMTFGRWRQQARLLQALRLLAAGESVTSAGLSVGFASTSAFVAMFRRALGKTPGRWFRDPGETMAP